MQPPQRAGTGVWLATSPLISEWRTKAETPPKPGVPGPIEWYLQLEAISDRNPDIFERKRVAVSALADAVGRDPNFVYEGLIFTEYDALWRGLDEGAEPSPKAVGARTRLYQQARMATFLRYRDGFVETLAAIPFTAEAAVHGYLRVVLDWARHWHGLTIADTSEITEAAAPFERGLRRGKNRERFLRITRFALPLIVEQDLHELFRLAALESSEVGSTQGSVVTDALALTVITDQLKVAVSHVVDDPTVTSLSATNLVRLTANQALGGALLRIRVRGRDEALIETRVLDEIRRWMIDPRADAVVQGRASQLLAELEQQFASLAMVRRAFTRGGDDE